jgi:DNA-binding NtrC family response regulator
VRELKNLIEKAVLLGEGPYLKLEDITLETFHADDATGRSNIGSGLPSITPAGVNLSSIIYDVESNYFEKALEMAEGNETRAAKLLGLSRDKFRYRRKKLGEKEGR